MLCPAWKAFSDLNLVYIYICISAAISTMACLLCKREGCRAYSNVTNNMSSSLGNGENRILKCDNVGENLILKRDNVGEYVSRTFLESWGILFHCQWDDVAKRAEQSMSWCCDEGRTGIDFLGRVQGAGCLLKNIYTGLLNSFWAKECEVHFDW